MPRSRPPLHARESWKSTHGESCAKDAQRELKRKQEGKQQQRHREHQAVAPAPRS